MVIRGVFKASTTFIKKIRKIYLGRNNTLTQIKYLSIKLMKLKWRRKRKKKKSVRKEIIKIKAQMK